MSWFPNYEQQTTEVYKPSFSSQLTHICQLIINQLTHNESTKSSCTYIHKHVFFKYGMLLFWELKFKLFFFYSVINFIHISVYMSIPIAQFSTPPSPPHRSFPPLVSIRLFSTSVSQLLPCTPVHLYHFSRFHIHALIYDICFSLSDLLHSVWQSLDPSTSQ